MTVGEIQNGWNGYQRSSNKGALDDDDFEYGSLSYTVQQLAVGTKSVSFIVDSAGLPESDTLTLELAGHEFPFSARRSFSDTTNWFWESPDELDHPATEFPDGTMATVCLRTEAQMCPSGDMMTPLSTDATLSALSLGTGVTLSPTFASGTNDYTASVANSVDEVTVTPTTNHASATVEYLDAGGMVLTDADDMEDGFQVALAVGSTYIVVLVTAEDSTIQIAYAVTVTRAAATPGTTPTLSIADAAASEGDAVEFTVTLSATSTEAVTVDWATSVESGDNATTGTDFTAASSTLTFMPGDERKTFTVMTTEDTASEANETFTVTLSGVSTTATLGTATATGTIDNDDAPAAPTNFAAAVGDTQVTLSWAAPESGSGVTRHEYRRKEGTGSYPANFTPIPDSGGGGTNQFTVMGLTNETAYTFELRSVAGTINGTADESDEVTPTPGICGRTAKIQEVILAELADVTDCAAVTVANLASITTFGVNGFGTFNQGITSLQAGDFAGLTALTILNLGQQPARVAARGDLLRSDRGHGHLFRSKPAYGAARGDVRESVESDSYHLGRERHHPDPGRAVYRADVSGLRGLECQ